MNQCLFTTSGGQLLCRQTGLDTASLFGHRETGIGLHPDGWINMVTINQAKNLLRQADIQVKRVADEFGSPEQFTFRKYFKAHTGMSPTEFRNGGR